MIDKDDPFLQMETPRERELKDREAGRIERTLNCIERVQECIDILENEDWFDCGFLYSLRDQAERGRCLTVAQEAALWNVEEVAAKVIDRRDANDEDGGWSGSGDL